VNALDIVCISIIIVSAGLGIYKGLIRTISSLIALIAALFLSKASSSFSSEIFSYINVTNPILVTLILFLIFFITAKIALNLLQKVSHATVLTSLDRGCGGLFGLAKGIIIAVLIFTVIQAALPKGSTILTRSFLLPYSNKIVGITEVFFPGDIYAYINKSRR